ncbi:3'-5' exoribonuclease YhaM family protein [Sedimentibacter sp. MB31-C6]|uniref:3'-5' exoribonuclease YhaM family protein n=1 Tax=Sedimentibacter sp. MB31-C6 TaxID=3109366 RepID=UPI002DDDB64C|nr:HD domain-containing protein [Sedimentibacter sp. MB36-C1]WSI04739.1 HD domain-containing protein [Sedimentibacter sp. MB36-C1]
MGQTSIGDLINSKEREQIKSMVYEHKNIAELKAGEKTEGFYLIKSFEVRKTTAGKQYIDINLVDKTGEVNAKIWEYSKETEKIVIENSIVKIRGEVLEWSGSKQVKINKIRAKLSTENIKISELIPSAPIETSEMLDTVKSYVKKIKDVQIKLLVENIMNKYNNKLLYYPAAKKNHHSYLGGLLYHTLRMIQSGEKLGQVYDYLNMDYVYAGVLLHDICKILEMDSDEYGVVSDYTMEGKLLGHIIQGIKEIEIEGEKIGLNREKSIVLQHMVLSHHYEPEFGSPKKPMTPEAELLHFLDIIDTRMFDFEHALEGVESGKFSDRIWLLDNRNIYKMQD